MNLGILNYCFDLNWIWGIWKKPRQLPIAIVKTSRLISSWLAHFWFQCFQRVFNYMVTMVETAGFCLFWLTPNVFKFNSIRLLSPGVTLLKGHKKRFALCKKGLFLNLQSKKIHHCLGQFRSGPSGINLDKDFNTNWDIWSFDRGTWLLFIKYLCLSANIET